MLRAKTRIAVPNKGRIRDPIIKLLEAAGLGPQYTPDNTRVLVAPTPNPDTVIVFLRHEDIPVAVEAGAVDIGFAGHDYVVEAGVAVREVLDVEIGRAKLMLAVPEGYADTVEELPKGVRIATKYVRIATNYVSRKGICARIVRVSGSAEIAPLLGIADAVIDVVSTGTTLSLHGLKPIDTVLETSVRLIVPKEVKSDVMDVVEIIASVVRARKLKLVMMNVPDRCLEKVLSVLPAMAGPSISRIEGAKEPMWEVITAVREDELAHVLLEAKRAGARDILVLNVERLIP